MYSKLLLFFQILVIVSLQSEAHSKTEVQSKTAISLSALLKEAFKSTTSLLADSQSISLYSFILSDNSSASWMIFVVALNKLKNTRKLRASFSEVFPPINSFIDINVIASKP